jgi:hypothetical protein
VGVMEGVGGVWKMRWMGWGFELKTRKPSSCTQFWVCLWKQTAGVMEGVGRVQEMRWLGWLGCLFDDAWRVGVLSQKPSGCTRFQVCWWEQTVGATEEVEGVWGMRAIHVMMLDSPLYTVEARSSLWCSTHICTHTPSTCFS